METGPLHNDIRPDPASEVHHVLQECFWGDYQLDAEGVLEKLKNRDLEFERFLFSKIVENSTYPSKRLRSLFDPRRLTELAEEYLQRKPRPPKRHRLIIANLTGRWDLAPEYRWKH
jgi:hypothetical protein